MRWGETALSAAAVTFDELDAGMVVYHANHLKICDRARNDCLDRLGWGIERQMALGQGFSVYSCEQVYPRPLKMGAITVATRLVAFSARSITVEHGIFAPGIDTADLNATLMSSGAGELKAIEGCRFFARLKLVFVASGKATAMPKEMTEALGLPGSGL